MLKMSILRPLEEQAMDTLDIRPAVARRRAPRGARRRSAPAGLHAGARRRDGADVRARAARHHADGVAGLRAADQGDQRAQEGAQRRHPGAQLHDAGDLQLRRRLPRRQLAARQGSGAHQGRRHRAGRRALHGRDVEAAQPRQDRAHPRSAGRLLAGRFDHARGRAHAARGLSGRADRHLRQHLAPR